MSVVIFFFKGLIILLQFKRLTRAYHQEAKWCQVSYFPTFEEYMSVACLSAGMKMLSITSIVLLGDVATREAFEWMSKDPLILNAIPVIGRLGNDIVGHEVRFNSKFATGVLLKKQYFFFNQNTT